MPHRWPDILRVTLCPDQVVLECGKLFISLKGVDPRYSAPEVIPVEPRHEPTLWAAPLAVLGIALDGLPERPHDVAVILSNHFVRYPLIHAQTGIPCELELNAGEIDEHLQSALDQLLLQHNCRLTSLQPRLMAVGGNLLDDFQGESGWIVTIEEGLASIGLVQDGEFLRFRSLYMWPASSVELLTLLDQEALLAGFRIPPRNLILWERDEFDDVTLPFNGNWQITRLGYRSTNPMPHRAVSNSSLLSSVGQNY